MTGRTASVDCMPHNLFIRDVEGRMVKVGVYEVSIQRDVDTSTGDYLFSLYFGSPIKANCRHISPLSSS